MESQLRAMAQLAPTAPVPPQSLDAEESVLGAMMLSPGAMATVSEILDPGDFYRESHAKVFRSALALWAKGEPVDAITVVDELDDRAEQVIFTLSQQRTSGDFAHIETLLKESFERITALYESGSDITGLASGFRDFDRLTSGFQPGNLVVVAARPSMGKSAFGLCVAANLAVRHGVPVAIFTLEMSKAEVTQRLMCSEGKVESQRLRSGRLAPG